MANSTLFKTYEQVGIKESISNIISNISPTDTPFLSSIKKESVNNVFVQWQEDKLRAAAANAQAEGFAATDKDISPTTMRANYTQILSDTVRVSGTADTVSTYGRAKESAYQLFKVAAELKNDLEYNLIGLATNATAGTTSTTGPAASAKKFGSVFGNDANGNAIISSTTTLDISASPAALSEAHIITLNETLYAAGGEATIIMVKPTDVKIINTFAQSSGRTLQIMQDDRKLVNTVDIYMGSFGEQKVVKNRYMKSDRALLYKPENWSLGVLRDWNTTELAKDGDRNRTMLLGEFTIKHKNYSSSAQIKGIT